MRFAVSFLFIDMGNPFLNHTVKAFLTIATIAAAKTAADEYYCVVKRGTVAGVYAGMDYGVKRIREERDWKNAMIASALTGAIVSAASNNNRDKIVMDAITGGVVATAMDFHNYLT